LLKAEVNKLLQKGFNPKNALPDGRVVTKNLNSSSINKT
jgi:hypothetical protein